MGSEFSDGDAVVADAARDLFGMPVLPPRGKGRPAHAATAETRQFVNLLLVCGYPPIAIAKALGLKRTAFYEHYREELRERDFAALKFRGRQLQRLNVAAENGNVAAEKALAGMVQAEQLRATSARIVDRGKKGEAKPAAIGKKEAARAAAQELGGIFETRQPPANLVN